jgi:hypothetical protein
MSSPNDDVFVNVIRTLANTTAVAVSNGYPRLADATIELQYVITSRIRPWLATGSLAPSTYAVLEYTVKALEAQVAADVPVIKKFACADTHADCMKKAKDTLEEALCLATYAACVAEHFTTVLEKARR